jgi:hypothetical protein
MSRGVFSAAVIVAAFALFGATAGHGANPGPNVTLSVSSAPGSVSLGHYVGSTTATRTT